MTEVAYTRERRDRVRAPREPRHRATASGRELLEQLHRARRPGLRGRPGVGIGHRPRLRPLPAGHRRPHRAADGEHRQDPAARRGVCAADRSATSRATASSTRRRGMPSGDSGIWQHLQAPSLPVADLATLVGATSDNLATNVLLRQVGLRLGARAHRIARPAAHRPARPGARQPRTGRRAAALGRLDRRAQLAVRRAGPRRGRRHPDQQPRARLALAQLRPVDGRQRLRPRSALAPRRRPRDAAGEQDRRRLRRARRGRGDARAAGRGRRTPSPSSSTTAGSAARLRVLDAMRTVGFDLLEYVH